MPPARACTHGFMALTPEELARRVRAARAYAGFKTQPELGELMKADGLGITDPGRLERPSGKKKPPRLTQARLDSLVKHTGLPATWFTEDLDLNPPERAEGDPVWEEIVSLHRELAEGLSRQAKAVGELRKAQGEMQKRLERLEPPGEEGGR
jgi:hypothetical protein